MQSPEKWEQFAKFFKNKMMPPGRSLVPQHPEINLPSVLQEHYLCHASEVLESLTPLFSQVYYLQNLKQRSLKPLLKKTYVDPTYHSSAKYLKKFVLSIKNLSNIKQPSRHLLITFSILPQHRNSTYSYK